MAKPNWNNYPVSLWPVKVRVKKYIRSKLFKLIKVLSWLLFVRCYSINVKDTRRLKKMKYFRRDEKVLVDKIKVAFINKVNYFPYIHYSVDIYGGNKDVSVDIDRVSKFKEQSL